MQTRTMRPVAGSGGIRTPFCRSNTAYQDLTNLDLLPPKGAVIVAAPLKIKQGSGSPLRVLALVAK